MTNIFLSSLTGSLVSYNWLKSCAVSKTGYLRFTYLLWNLHLEPCNDPIWMGLLAMWSWYFDILDLKSCCLLGSQSYDFNFFFSNWKLQYAFRAMAAFKFYVLEGKFNFSLLLYFCLFLSPVSLYRWEVLTVTLWISPCMCPSLMLSVWIQTVK